MSDNTQLTQTRLKQALRDVDELKVTVEKLVEEVKDLQEKLRIEHEWREELQKRAKNFLKGE